MSSIAARASVQDSLSGRVLFDTVRVTAPTDTSKVRKRSTLNDTWYYGSEPNKRYLIDSSIFQLHRYDVVRRDGEEYFNMGNTGTAAYPVIFNPATAVGFNMGFRQFDAYRYSKDSIRYYQVIRPYAELFYSLGITNEQVIQGRFANSHKVGILYGVDFRRINSKGTYDNQKALDNGFSLYGVYTSKNKRLNIETDLIYNSFVVNENGGLTQDVFFKDTTFFTKSLAPHYLNAAILNYNEIDWFLKGSYNLGRKYNERVNDTLVNKVTLPVFKVSYMLDIERGKYTYFDLPQDSGYYKGIKIGDTLRYKTTYTKIGERLGLDFNAKKLTSDSTYKELNFLMGAGLSFDYYMMREFQLSHDFANLYVSGYLKSNPALNPRLIYKASVAYYMAGYNQNDLMLDGQLGVDLRQYGRLTAGATYKLQQSDWVYHSFRADTSVGVNYINTVTGATVTGQLDSLTFKYSNNFPKMSTFRFGGEYALSQYGIKVSAYNYLLKNYFYFSGPNTPAFEPSAINVLVLSFSNRFGYKGFHFDNDVWFQKSAGSDVIRLPLVATRHSVYYERHIFKKALLFAFGVDLRYYTPYFANGYSPFTGQFYKQDVQQMKFYPILDVFLNVKVKTVRVFLMGTNLSSFFGKQNGYYTAYYYPAADASFKFGAAWRFFE